MWDLPGPGIEPMSPALAGRLLTTGPPGNLVLFDMLSDGVMEEKKKKCCITTSERMGSTHKESLKTLVT